MIRGAHGYVERHQVALYLSAIAVGVLIGLGLPSLGPTLAHGINPLLAALLYVTFLQVPADRLVAALRDARFMSAIVVANFVAVPLVAAALFAFLPSDDALRIGVLLVLLCPCVDYVIVFAGLAGGDNRRLVAATPVLLLLQMALLPLFLMAFMRGDLRSVVDLRPFLEAFLVLIVGPLVLAWITQWRAGRAAGGPRVVSGVSALMVPLMMAVLTVVVASQVPKIDGSLGDVGAVIPFYVIFLVVMAAIGMGAGAAFRLDVPARRSLVFSGVTRNSLVVLPLALALPAGYELAAAVVVTQTLVEIIGMVVFVRTVPRLIPRR